MQKPQDTTIILLIVIIILLGYLLSEKYLKQEPVVPKYQEYDQTNRLRKIRQGLDK